MENKSIYWTRHQHEKYIQLYQIKTWLHYLDAFARLTLHRSRLLLKTPCVRVHNKDDIGSLISGVTNKKVKQQRATCNNQVTNDKQR